MFHQSLRAVPALFFAAFLAVAPVALAQRNSFARPSDGPVSTLSPEERRANEATGVETNGVYAETEVRHSWFSFSKPDGKSAEAQMAHADKLLADGKTKAAGKAYRSLVLTWPRAVQAAPAQLRFAETLEKRGELEDSFAAYEVLLDRYVGSFDYEAVIAAQFAIAKEMMEERRGSFLMFGGWKAPERAIPMFESILKNAPRWSGAAEAQFLTGVANEQIDELELAIVAYMAVQHRYPDSEFAAKAARGRVKALNRLADESPNDEEALEQAYAAAVLFLQGFPKSDHADEVTGWRDELLRRRAKMAYDKGAFYEKVARKPAAAIQAYENFARLYPTSEWAPVAQARIAALRPLVPPKPATP